MNIETKPPKLRILSGTPQAVEYELNLLLNDYAALLWNFAGTGDQVTVTVVLIAASEIRMQQMMQGSKGRGI